MDNNDATSANTYTVMEFHMSRELPNAAGFVLGLSGATWLFFSIADEDTPFFLGIIGLLLLLFSVICFKFKKIVRVDKRTGKIEKSVSTFLWKQSKHYSVDDFTGVGIGMGGGHTEHSMRTRYFVQLLGSTNLKIPGMSTNKEASISLAEQVGDYLDLPVNKVPKIVFFQARL